MTDNFHWVTYLFISSTYHDNDTWPKTTFLGKPGYELFA